jgi:hypothetical protein
MCVDIHLPYFTSIDPIISKNLWTYEQKNYTNLEP